MKITDSPFISNTYILNDKYVSEIGIIDIKKYSLLCKTGILPTYFKGDDCYHLVSDLLALRCALTDVTTNDNLTVNKSTLFEIEVTKTIYIGNNTIVSNISESNIQDVTFYSAMRNIISYCSNETKCNDKLINIQYFANTTLTTCSKAVAEYANEQLIRNKKIDIADKSQFARSAYYMGSKSSLCGYVIEAVSSCINNTGSVVDLMCGSGVLSGAFNKIWKTYSSDAQEFSRILAAVHGSAFSKSDAKNLLSYILPIAESHFKDIQSKISAELELEDNLFCQDIDDELINRYNEFIVTTPTYSNGRYTDKWNPLYEVSSRQSCQYEYPYCLFTAYFANSYFGLRQCAEIDSIRYAVDQISDEKDKNLALAALISTLSVLGITYGHFAQPRVVTYNDLTLNKLSSIINKRSYSVTHEFAVRFLNLTDNNTCFVEDITIVPGPWLNALRKLENQLNHNTVVYVDAPYTREEYSRYYHVLETLVVYNYPSCQGRGLTPLPHERFKSEFSTRTNIKIVESYTTLINSILQRGCICALSHSSSATVSTFDVICEVIKTNSNCSVMSYSAPYVYRSQGGYKNKPVVEYIVIFRPK
jgi:adenine-specific DNA methylase